VTPPARRQRRFLKPRFQHLIRDCGSRALPSAENARQFAIVTLQLVRRHSTARAFAQMCRQAMPVVRQKLGVHASIDQ
jgi:hypothetical protein